MIVGVILFTVTLHVADVFEPSFALAIIFALPEELPVIMPF